MSAFKLEKQTSISTVIAQIVKQLRMYGVEYLRSGGDRSKIDPDFQGQEYVAKALNITKAAYSKIENGDVAITVYHLGQLCAGYEIEWRELMAYVDKRIKELEDDGIFVINAKIALRLDHLRWKEKIEEKTEANFNKMIRELKKNKTYNLHSEKEIEAIKLDCKNMAKSELNKKYDLGEAISMQSFGMV